MISSPLYDLYLLNYAFKLMKNLPIQIALKMKQNYFLTVREIMEILPNDHLLINTSDKRNQTTIQLYDLRSSLENT